MINTAQVVSVDYAPQLARTLPVWKTMCGRILVVTAERDVDTRRIAEEHGCEVLLTDAFWRDGAKFNKGRAIAEAYEVLQPTEWHLFFDADVLPGPAFAHQLESFRLTRNCLYGCDRFLEDGTLIREGELAGCFHLAWADQPAMHVRPIVDTHWLHAGNYDSTFQTRWPRQCRIKLPLRLTHLGSPFRNWCGVGNDQAMGDLWAERRKRGNTFGHEAITPSPPESVSPAS